MHHTEVCAKRVTFLFVCSVCHLTFVSKRGAWDEAAKLASCAPGFVQHFRKTPQDIFQETSGQFPAVLAVTITKKCMGNPIQSRSWRQNWSLTLGHFQPCLWWPKQVSCFKHNHYVFLILSKCFLCLNVIRSWSQCCDKGRNRKLKRLKDLKF